MLLSQKKCREKQDQIRNQQSLLRNNILYLCRRAGQIGIPVEYRFLVLTV